MKNFKIFKKLALFQIFVFLFSTLDSAAGPLLELDTDTSAKGQSEFFNSNRGKRMLVKVNILSGVSKPGIHYVPDDTNLVDFLSLAGGITAGADPEEISIRRISKDGIETLNYDMTEIIRDKDVPVPALTNNDTIFIEESSGFRQELIIHLSIIASILGIISSTLLINSALKQK